MKYIVISGGVASGCGKGITASSVGVLLQESGLTVSYTKLDGYLNKGNSSLLAPSEHGEAFVLADGGEVDLDAGSAERFLGVQLTRDHFISNGKLFSHVIAKEAKGGYLGQTVQFVPHVTDALQEWLERVSHIPVHPSKPGVQPDVMLIEVGGTIGDMESMVFFEALRQLRYCVGADNFVLLHVALLPSLGELGELKTKPLQNSVIALRGAGLSPDFLVCRSVRRMDAATIHKVARFAMIHPKAVLSVFDVHNIYAVPELLLECGLAQQLLSRLHMSTEKYTAPTTLPRWNALAEQADAAPSEVRIALVGKYIGATDAYLSVSKALEHAGAECDTRVKIVWIDSSHLDAAQTGTRQFQLATEQLNQAHGILVPGGFGVRGVDGMIEAIRYARINCVPFLGICLGFQTAVIEHARNVLGWTDATSAEFDTDPAPAPAPAVSSLSCSSQQHHPGKRHVVIHMPEISSTHLGGTMRLGARTSSLKANSLASRVYGGAIEVEERHRHRYEINPAYVTQLGDRGLIFSGVDRDERIRMEFCERSESEHPFFLATQAHPEFLSRPFSSSPPFVGFVRAACNNRIA